MGVSPYQEYNLGPLIRIAVEWDLYWDPLIFGNYHGAGGIGILRVLGCYPNHGESHGKGHGSQNES